MKKKPPYQSGPSRAHSEGYTTRPVSFPPDINPLKKRRTNPTRSSSSPRTGTLPTLVTSSQSRALNNLFCHVPVRARPRSSPADGRDAPRLQTDTALNSSPFQTPRLPLSQTWCVCVIFGQTFYHFNGHLVERRPFGKVDGGQSRNRNEIT